MNSLSSPVLLVNPPDIYSSHFPFGLACVAGMLLADGYGVEVLDFVNHSSTEPGLIDRVVERVNISQARIVGLTGMAHHYRWLRDLVRRLKAECSGVSVMAGGHWACYEPSLVLRTTAVDVVVNGEADLVVGPLVRALASDGELGRLPGITFRNRDAIVSTGAATLLRELDAVPLPPYQLFDMRQYVIQERWGGQASGAATLSMQTGRGCVGKCMFCTGADQLFRKHTPAYVVRHIKLTQERFGVKNIRFKEAMTLGNRRWVEEFCDRLIEEQLNIRYECISRVDTINEDLARRLARSGCDKIQFGIESGDDYILSEIAQKHISARMARQAVKLCIRHGIIPAGGFIIGLPQESFRSLNKTLFFIMTTRVEETGVTFPTPFPGTRLFEMALNRFGIERERLFADPDVLHYGVEAQDRLIAKYNFTGLHQEVLKLYRFLFYQTFACNRLLRTKRYLRLALELCGMLEIKVLLRTMKAIVSYVRIEMRLRAPVSADSGLAKVNL